MYRDNGGIAVDDSDNEEIKMDLFEHIDAFPHLYRLDGGEIASVLMTIISNLCLITDIKPHEFRNQMQTIVLQYRDLYEDFNDVKQKD